MGNNQWFHDILNRSLETFAHYWGFKKVKNDWKKKGRTSSYDVIERVEGLQAALDWDSTGLTAFMMLRAYLHQLLHSTTFTAYDLMLNWENHKINFDRLNAMRVELEKPEALEILTEYQETVKQMGRHYKIKAEKAFDAFVTNPIDLGFLRHSAYLSLEKKLKPFQFIQGAGTTEPLKVHQKVYEFWNINSVVEAAARQHFDGVALCLIRDPKFFASFFVIAVKAGENLTILTDREKGAHPRYNEMTRRPDRDLDSRMGENWFPYQLLEIEVSEDGKYLYEKQRTDLVPKNQKMFALANVGDLDPPQVAWLGILLDLIAKRYGGAEPLKLPALSYTAEMIRIPTALVPAASSLIQQGKYQPLELPVIQPEDITAEKVAANFEKESYGFNRHLVNRFVDQVPTAIYDLIGENEVKQLRADNQTLSKKNFDVWGKSVGHEIELRSYSPMDFGTPDELEKDRIWTARFNQISYINHLAQKEFNAKREEICLWYSLHVHNNKKRLLEYFKNFKCPAKTQVWKSSRGGGFPFRDEQQEKTINLLTVAQIKDDKRGWGSVYNAFAHTRSDYGNVQFGEFDQYYRCFAYRSRASVFGWFEPRTAEHLALLAGVRVEQLPEQIRYWFRKKDKPYVGNQIIDRLDPEDWYLSDPWRGLEFKVSFFFCRSYLNDFRKQRGLPKMNWDELP